MLYGIKLTSSYMLRWSPHLKEAKANPTQLHRVSHHLLELLAIAGVFWHLQLILTTFVLHLSPRSHFPRHWNPFCRAVIKTRQRKGLEKKVWFFPLHETLAKKAPRALAESFSRCGYLGFAQTFSNLFCVARSQYKMGWFGCSELDQRTGSGN